MDKNIEGTNIKTKIGNLKVTRNIASLATVFGPLGATIALTEFSNKPVECVITLGASVVCLGWNSYVVATSQREINILKEQKQLYLKK